MGFFFLLFLGAGVIFWGGVEDYGQSCFSCTYIFCEQHDDWICEIDLLIIFSLQMFCLLVSLYATVNLTS